MTVTWDSIVLHDWTRSARPQPWVLSVATTGCGCCSDGEVFYNNDEAVAEVKRYIEERRQELLLWERWLEVAQMASTIPGPVEA